MSDEPKQLKLITTREAAKVLGISDARVRQLIYEGQLPAEKIGNSNLILESDLSKVTIHGKAGRPKKNASEGQETGKD